MLTMSHDPVNPAREPETLAEHFLQAREICQALKTVFVITPEEEFLMLPLASSVSNLRRIQEAVGAEVVALHPIVGGDFDGWLLVLNDYPQGAQNTLLTELVGASFTILGRGILAPPGVID